MGFMDYLKYKHVPVEIAEKKTYSFVMRTGDFSWDRILEYSKEKQPQFYRNVGVIYRCVNLIADNVATLPIQLVKRATGKDGDEMVIDNHPVLNLLQGRANEYQSGSDMLRFTASGVLISGNAYTRRAGSEGSPVALYPYFPQNMKVEEREKPVEGADNSERYIHYEYVKSGGGIVDIPQDEMWHVRTYNPESMIEGLSPLSVARRPAEMGQYLEEWNRNLIKNEGTPPTLLIFKDTMTDGEFQEAKKRLSEGWQGPSNAGKPQIVTGDMKVERIALSPKDIDWVMGEKITIKKIANVYGIDPGLLGDESNKTYSNQKEARQALYQEVVIPWGRFILDSLAFFFFWDKSQNRTTHYFRVNEERIPVLQMSIDKKVAALKDAWWFTPNERRREMGKSDLTDPNMDQIWLPPGFQPMDDYGEGDEPPKDM